jgi:PadR family transcriptional regulator PadR
VPRNRALSPQTLSVLCALAADPTQWRHGYDLGAETWLKAGSLYPILVRLADRGFLEAKWEEAPPQGRPARHLYRLTPDGLETAAANAARAGDAATASPARASRARAHSHGQIPQAGGAT